MGISIKTGIIVLILLLLVISLVVACSDGGETSTTSTTPSPTAESTEIPADKPTTEDRTNTDNEPPANPFLADSSWSMNHRNSYCQGSSPLPGLTQLPIGAEEDFLLGRVATIMCNFSTPYPDGKRVIWASNYGQVVKIDPEGDKLSYIDRTQSLDVTYFPDVMAENLVDQNCREVAEFLEPLLPNEDINLREGEAIGGASGINCVLSSDMTFYQPLM